MALNQAWASKPVNRLTPEAARAQVAEHRAEAEAEFYRQPKFAQIARRQKWIDPNQSLNLFLPQADLKILYYLSASNVEKATISVKENARITNKCPIPTSLMGETFTKSVLVLVKKPGSHRKCPRNTAFT